jgi:uncharacterized RmlC-like cupin family protein
MFRNTLIRLAACMRVGVDAVVSDDTGSLMRPRFHLECGRALPAGTARPLRLVVVSGSSRKTSGDCVQRRRPGAVRAGIGNPLQKDGDRMNGVVMIVALASLVAQGGATPGVHVWTSADIAAKGKTLAQKLDANKVASEVISSEGNRTFMIAHREGSGQAELHDKQADVIMISTGNITMVYGGKVVDGKVTGPGETRGPSISGGTEVKLGPGDVLHIPAKVPHQMKLDPGKQVTYFVTKVVE